LHASLGQRFLKGRNALGATKESVQGGNLAEHFIPQERELFVGLPFGRFLNGGKTLLHKARAGVALIEERACDEGAYGDHDENNDSEQYGHGFLIIC
jgi:hypothetical protein